MEALSLIQTGAWSVIPPILALALALITKEVYSSLAIGIFSGMLIYTFSSSGVSPDAVIQSFTLMPEMMYTQITDNGPLILFLALLGALTVVIAMTGGSRAYGEWVTKHVKNARAAQIMTAILGIVIFVDDYFNCLTVGAVMRPVTDRFKVSREKLAWIIDSTAAPVCIIAPVSSWAVAVGAYLEEADGFTTFVQSIPYNFYALLTVLFVFVMCATKFEFGPMKAAQDKAQGIEGSHVLTGNNFLKKIATIGTDAQATNKTPADLNPIVTEEDDIEQVAGGIEDEYKGLSISDKGKVYDLIIPIVVLVIFSILGMLYVGGFWSSEGQVPFTEAIGVNPVAGLCIGASVALLVAAALFLPRGLMKLEGFVEGISEGVRSMVGAIMILVLAWSLGSVCSDMLGTGEFVSEVVTNIGVGLELLPVVIFVVSAFIGFAMGTSWGTIALIMPIVITLFDPATPLFLVAVGATLGGAVYGDHVSPISDTTILSSAGAKCNHLRHVSTQLPYASLVMGISIVGYVVAGFVPNPWIPLAICVVLLLMSIVVLSKLSNNRKVKN